jgi:hypothetical protein
MNTRVYFILHTQKGSEYTKTTESIKQLVTLSCLKKFKIKTKFKGTRSPDGLRYFLYEWIDVGIKASWVVFEFSNYLQRLSIEINLFLPVNENISWLIMLVVVHAVDNLTKTLALISLSGLSNLAGRSL